MSPLRLLKKTYLKLNICLFSMNCILIKKTIYSRVYRKNVFYNNKDFKNLLKLNIWRFKVIGRHVWDVAERGHEAGGSHQGAVCWPGDWHAVAALNDFVDKVSWRWNLGKNILHITQSTHAHTHSLLLNM